MSDLTRREFLARTAATYGALAAAGPEIAGQAPPVAPT
jgi:hypothetical protein